MFHKKQSELYGVIGLGRFGFALAQTLAEAGREVLAVDHDPNRVKDAAVFTDMAFTVDNLSKEILQDIGIKNCDAVIVCIGEKIDVSILTTLNVINLGIPRVISKATSAEQGSVLEKLGAEVVYPERDMAIKLANRLIGSRVMEYISLSDEMDISELHLTKKAAGQTVVEMDLRGKYGLNIIAARQGTKISTNIRPTMVFEENDVIVVIGGRGDIERYRNHLEK